MELMLYFLREDTEQADTDSFGTGGDLFYVGAVTSGAVRFWTAFLGFRFCAIFSFTLFAFNFALFVVCNTFFV